MLTDSGQRVCTEPVRCGSYVRRVRDPDAAPREYDPETYWKNPAAIGEPKGLTPAYWADPWPNVQGMLTSEHIRAYHEEVGRMIRPFDPDCLRPASYELTLGNSCVVEGEPVVLTDDDPLLTIPPNSIAYVAMQQVLLIPHYLVGRFDLAIEFIYKGLLLGTGPQIDPGFQGALSCPLHNISNDPIEIRLGQAFAKLDFAKTAPRSDNISASLRDLSTEDELVNWFQADPPDSMRLFKGGHQLWRKPIYGYLDGRRPQSSVRKLHDDFGRLQKDVRSEVRRLRDRFNVGLAIGVLTLVLGIPSFVFGVVESRDRGLASKDELTRLDERTKRLEATTQKDLTEQVKTLKAEVCRLRKQRPRFC